MFQLSTCFSPATNSNLLTRSEVVALINTLHRFTESLVYVNDFRRMWAEAPDDESQKLIKEAEKALTDAVSFYSGEYTRASSLTSLKPQITPSPDPLLLRTHGSTGSPKQRDIYRLWKERFWGFISLCRRCTSDCLSSCRRVVDSVLELTRSSIQSFKGDKRGPPHSDL